MAHWFETTSADCTSVVMVRHASAADASVVASVSVNDVDAVRKLAARIEALSPNGDEMMSFGPQAEHLTLTFSCAGVQKKIDLYQKRFKTPSTGFHSVESPAEAALYADIDALLFPDFGKKLLKVQGLALRFKNFSITYLGQAATDGAPATLSFVREAFLVTDKDGQSQTLSVVAGQLPPPPLSFKAGGSKPTLLTYESKARERLYPDYFQVAK